MPLVKCKSLIQCVFLLTLVLSSMQSVVAQQTLGGIVGTVTDPQGGLLPGVTVTVVGEGTNLTRTATSSDSGSYAVPNLPIGSYTISFSRDGFSTTRFPGIAIQANRTATLPAQLTVGRRTTMLRSRRLR